MACCPCRRTAIPQTQRTAARQRAKRQTVQKPPPTAHKRPTSRP